MHQRALSLFRGAARRAHTRAYSERANRIVRLWQFPDGADRLVPEPVFLLSSAGSGSTLLRKLLDTNSRICAPKGMHLSLWRVDTESKSAKAALAAKGMNPTDLADILWDRLLHLELIKSQKSIIVDQTPHNALIWTRVATAWPRARFLILVRHPERVAEWLAAAHPEVAAEVHYAHVERYALALHDAQRHAPSALTVRYEDLADDVSATTRRIAEWLNVPWEAAMVSRANGKRGSAGASVPSVPDPDPSTVPEGLLKSCELLGYL